MCLMNPPEIPGHIGSAPGTFAGKRLGFERAAYGAPLPAADVMTRFRLLAELLSKVGMHQTDIRDILVEPLHIVMAARQTRDVSTQTGTPLIETIISTIPRNGC